jgi:VanZ family protein
MRQPTKRLWLINYVRQPVKPIYGLIWLMLTLYLCLSPASSLPEDTWFSLIPFFDKLVHFALFFGITLSWLNLASPRIERTIMIVLLFGLGWLIEYLQTFIPGRSFDYQDIIADVCGVLIASILLLWPLKK